MTVHSVQYSKRSRSCPFDGNAGSDHVVDLRPYGTENPTPDANSIGRRGSTLAFDKKVILVFMPNRDKWSVTRAEGNPMQSVEVNGLIKHIKKKEAQKQGAESKTQCPLNGAEFEALHGILNWFEHLSLENDKEGSNGETWKRYGITGLVNFQFHLILARINDSTQLVLEHIQVHNIFPNALKTRLNWSKNVQDERDAPWQIVLGSSINPVYCVFCSLRLWLELNLGLFDPAMNYPHVFAFADNNTIPG